MTITRQDLETPALAPAPLIYGAFALGLTTAIAFRVIIILQHVAPGWVRPVWYFGVVGNLVFFYYRYRIAEKRKRAVDEHGLIGRIEADACFSPESIAALDAELPVAAGAAQPREALASLARRHAVPRAPGELEALRPAIDLHFGRESVAAILDSLESDSRPEFQAWAAKTAVLLAERSPTLLPVTFEQLRRGRNLGLADCFRLELNLIHGCFAQRDFVEGIRALIVDKDNAPRWNPPSLTEVTDASVAAFFAPRWSPPEHPLRHL